MASNSRKKLILEVIATDSTFQKVDRGWLGKCIHCNSHVLISGDGEIRGKATLEHIVPRAYGGANSPDNLAIACARCNHEKGTRHDPKGPGDPGFDRVVSYLLKQKARRRRDFGAT